MFFDTNEFLFINNNEALKEFLRNKRFRISNVIKINWLIYNNDIVHFENKPVLERFKIQFINPNDNLHIKSIINKKFIKEDLLIIKHMMLFKKD